MRNYIVFAILIMLTAACSKPPAVQVDLANACAADNDGKYISTSGFLDDKGSIFCSNTGGRMDCSLDFIAAPGSPRVLGAEIEEGSGASEIEKFDKSYKRDDLKIRDANGALIKLTDKVTITGKLSVVPGSTCFMEIDKIEKSQ
jgi:hypothetical protein